MSLELLYIVLNTRIASNFVQATILWSTVPTSDSARNFLIGLSAANVSVNGQLTRDGLNKQSPIGSFVLLFLSHASRLDTQQRTSIYHTGSRESLRIYRVPG